MVLLQRPSSLLLHERCASVLPPSLVCGGRRDYIYVERTVSSAGYYYNTHTTMAYRRNDRVPLWCSTPKSCLRPGYQRCHYCLLTVTSSSDDDSSLFFSRASPSTRHGIRTFPRVSIVLAKGYRRLVSSRATIRILFHRRDALTGPDLSSYVMDATDNNI